MTGSSLFSSSFDCALLLQTLMELAADAILIADANGVLAKVNDRACELLGYRNQDLVGTAIADLHLPQSTTPQVASHPQTVTWAYPHQNGSSISLEVRCKTLPDGWSVVLMQEVSDRRQAEMALREKEQQLQELSDSMPQFVWMTNAQGGLEYVNRQWCEYSGLTLEQCRESAQIIQCYHPEDRAAILGGWAIALATKQTFEIEGRLKRSDDGTYRWFLIRAVPVLDQQGQVLRWYGTSTDIHDRKQAQLDAKFLNELDLRLRQLSDTDAVLWEAVSRIGAYLNVESCVWHEVNLQEEIVVKQSWRREGNSASVSGVYPLAEFILPALIDQYQAGQPAVVSDVATYPYTAPFAQNFIERDIRAFVGVPCIHEGRWVAVLAINARTVQVWQPNQVTLLQNAVARLWSMIEQTKTIQMLRESEERLRLVLQNAPLPIMLHTEAGEVLQVNQVWAEITGYHLEDIPTLEAWTEKAYGDRKEEVISTIFAQYPLTQRKPMGEYVITTRTGATRIWDFYAAPLQILPDERTLVIVTAIDVTERKQVEADLQKYKDIFQFAEHGLAISRGPMLERVNPAFAQMHGYTVEELTDSPILNLFPLEAHAETIQFFQRLEAAGHLTHESVHLYKDGTRFPVLLDVTIVPDDPHPPYRIVNLFDITARKQAEQAILNLNHELQRQLTESQTLLEVIPIGIGIAEDPQCEKIRVNSAFAQMLAIASTVNASLSAPETERPTNFKVYQNQRELAPEELPLQFAATHGIEVRGCEVDVVWQDGTTLTLLEYAAPLFDEHGQPRGSIGAFLDITERKQAEVALQQSLKDLADLKFALDQSAIVAITDMHGTITYVNDKFCELSQYSREELIGQNHRIINSGHHPKAFFGHLWATISQGQVWQGEIRNRAKDGTFYWVATTIVPFLDPAGKPYQYIAVRSDITTRKAAEDELQQLNTTLEQRVEERTAQLQEANKDLEAFSYTVAHDLRAPIRGIKGFAQALIEDYSDRMDETAQDYIRHILNGSDRMNSLVSDLLAYSRLSREQIQLTPVQLAQVVAEAQAQLEADLRDRQAVVTVAADLPTVLGHRSILVQMVANLLSNAVKFVDPSIQPQVHIWAHIQENWVRLWVEDNGIGIAPQYQEQIFGVFERLHGIQAYPGTGIGLAIVRKGAERLEGRAGLESTPDQGSRFWIELHQA